MELEVWARYAERKAKGESLLLRAFRDEVERILPMSEVSSTMSEVHAAYGELRLDDPETDELDDEFIRRACDRRQRRGRE